MAVSMIKSALSRNSLISSNLYEKPQFSIFSLSNNLLNNNYILEFGLNFSLNSHLLQSHHLVSYELAVPKRRTSHSRSSHRRAGQRAQNVRREFIHHYRICLNCGGAVKQHHLCQKCKRVIARF